MTNKKQEAMNTISIILITTLLVMFFCICKLYENSYSIDAKVSNVQSESVTFEDVTGNVWMWGLEEGEQYQKGEKVTLYFYDNNTDVRYDDEIKKVRIKGK